MWAAERAPALAARRVSKSFGGVTALNEVSLTVAVGEAHGLVGENGSGKSTLIRILAGYHAPDPGAELNVGGRPVSLPVPAGRPRELGLSFVHQDLGLIPSLSVLENLRLSELAAARRWRISWRLERERARETLARFGLDLDPDATVGGLAPVERALLAIVRAVHELQAAGPGGVLVLDEPTAFLPAAETARVLALVRDLAHDGAGVLFVSHDLDEVIAASDRVSVLRDGRIVGTLATDGLDRHALASLIAGGPIAVARRRASKSAASTIAVGDLGGELVGDLSFELHGDEVLGLTGLAGSGFEEIPYLLFGLGRRPRGHITLDGVRLDVAALTPARALRAGMALLPGDREGYGGVGSMSVADNVTLPILDRYSRSHRLSRRRLLAGADDLIARVGVRPADGRVALQTLSGGNQQKALLARTVGSNPRLLLLHDPTRGVDVAARAQLFALLRAGAGAGTSVLCASSDDEELVAVCDRVLVLSGGRVTCQLAGQDLMRERIAAAVRERSW